ncbi:hypothetical protein [Thiomonas sp. FB-6]|uniref:hypothetical protein n=1 Tax=Thiomonas sp. FB-6 TaxID=1158291 RepID=UPI001E572B17|nr:hypothetical protein [Thiomonas sp. FB-6]
MLQRRRLAAAERWFEEQRAIWADRYHNLDKLLDKLQGAAHESCIAIRLRRGQGRKPLQKVIDVGMKEGLASTLERLDELLDALRA